ncbi:hypothetical protein QOT17_004822 [Balamuthia mandrillaris]
MERRYAASDDDDEESEEDFVRVSSGSEGGEEGQVVEHYLSEKEGGDQDDAFDFVVMSDHEEEEEGEGEEEEEANGEGGGALAASGGLVGGEEDEEEEEDDEDMLPRRVLQQRSQDELEEEERFLSFQNLQQRRRHQREKKQLLGGRRDYHPHHKRKQDPSKPQEEEEEEQEKREGQEERPYSSSSGYASGSGSASSSSDNVKEEEGEANQGRGDSPSLSSSSNEHHAKRTSTALLLSTSSDGLLPSSSSSSSSSHSAQQQLSASSEKHQLPEEPEEPEEPKRGRFASWWPFVTAFFVTVATVLGTGILGLPIRVADSGFTPMLLTYTWGVVMQALVLFFMVELLQRTKIVQDQQDRQNQQRTQLSRASLRDQELGFITPLQFNPARTSTIKDEERRHKRSHKRQEMPDEEDYYLSGSEEEESRRSTSTEVRDSEEFVPIELADEDYEYLEGEEEYGANEEEEEEEEHDALESGRIRRGSHRRRELGRIRYVQMAGTEQEGYLQCYGKEFGGLEKGPDLHTMGSLFLGRYLRHVFDAAVMLHFISILISYSLAASEAYAHIMNVPHTLLILPFIILFGSVVIFGSLFISGIISFLTLGKGFLLIMMVVVTGIVGAEADHPISNNWRYVGQPFLIGTVALGGAANTLPVVFAKIGFHRKDMIKLTAATVLGLFTTYVLNIIWCYYVLKIVPQHGGSISLELAGEEGHIATVPLIDIIRRDFPEYRWIAVLVDVFIMVSVTVSFITVGIGLKHTLDGYVKNWKARDFHFEWFSAKTNFILERLWNAPPLYRQSFLYSICFGIVMLFAQANPKSFLVVMEVVTSLALNIESGCLVVVMLGTSRLLQHNLSIPYVLPAWLFQLRWPVLFYFTFAVFYDLLSVVFQIVN